MRFLRRLRRRFFPRPTDEIEDLRKAFQKGYNKPIGKIISVSETERGLEVEFTLEGVVDTSFADDYRNWVREQNLKAFEKEAETPLFPKEKK